MLDVFAGIVANSLLRFLNQVVAFAELGRARGTDIGASGLLSSGHPVGAHRALLHLGQHFAPLVLGHAKGTRHHAVAASHAAVSVVSDRTGSRLAQGSYGTH